jgi:uncharacterized protein YecE (DUF72 family)
MHGLSYYLFLLIGVFYHNSNFANIRIEYNVLSSHPLIATLSWDRKRIIQVMGCRPLLYILPHKKLIGFPEKYRICSEYLNPYIYLEVGGPCLLIRRSMTESSQTNPQTFHFRNLHPQILIGTASDRYAGWIGQVYSLDRYEGRITKRTKIIGANTYTEEVLPVESVGEYFDHFQVLEIDFTFYRPLLDQNGQPTQNYQVLKNYSRYLEDGDRIILKVPQLITAQKIHRGDQHIKNEDYLNPKAFIDQFYGPAVDLLGPNLTGFIFEQEYHHKKDRAPVKEMALALDKFFSQIPKDSRYHVELRTDLYLREPVFEVLERYGIGQVLSYWTWLPPLRKQLAKADGRFFNRECVIRLLTPLGTRYDNSYEKAYPFDRLVEGLLQPEMVLETAAIIRGALEKGVLVNLIINNRAGGNAPIIAQIIAEKLIPKSTPKTKGQMSLW